MDNLHHQQQSSHSHQNAFPVFHQSLVTPIITTVDPSSIMNNANNSQASPSVNSDDQLKNVQLQNQNLTRKLNNKQIENEKLARKVDRVESELQSYKNLLAQINMSLETGGTLNSDAVKFAIQNAAANSKNGKSSKSKSKGGGGGGGGGGYRSCKTGVKCNCHQDRPYQCEFPDCGKRFRQKHHLDSHRAIHTGQRFVCEWPGCDKSFVRKYNLQEHTKMHQDQTHNRCMYPNCGMVFSSKYSLERHQAAQHNLKINM